MKRESPEERCRNEDGQLVAWAIPYEEAIDETLAKLAASKPRFISGAPLSLVTNDPEWDVQ